MTERSGKSESIGKYGEVRKADPNSFKIRFGELVKNRRVRKGLTQTDVARLVFNDEEAKSRVSDVERGRNEPQADTINRFCEALEIAYEDVEALRTTNSIIPPQLSPEHMLHPDIRPVPGFVGREDLLKGIEDALWRTGGGTAALTNSDAHAAAVKGLGGVGKSVLAREYAWQTRGRYRGVWWVRAETEQTLIDDLIDFGSRLIPNLKEVQERDRALHLALDAIATEGADKPWLIVYDNVEKPGAIAKLTPRERAHILITSRWPHWKNHAQELPVDVFPPETAVDFLLAERPHEAREAAARLAAALGHLPLALSHARAYCAFSSVSFASYLQRLPELIKKAPKDTDYPESVFATFSLAMDKAAENCPQAEKLMGIAAFLEAEHIPLGIITGDVMSESERDDAVAALAAVSLLTCGTSENSRETVTVHRLVQEVMRGRLGENRRETQQIALRLMHSALGAVWSRDHEKWPHIAKLLPHCIAVFDFVEEGNNLPKVAEFSNLLGVYFRLRGDYRASNLYLTRALSISEAVSGIDHYETTVYLNNLARLYYEQGRYDAAEPLYKRALAITEATLGPDDLETGKLLHHIAELYNRQHRDDEAEPLFVRALAIAESALGKDHHETGACLHNLAKLYANQGRNEAEAHFARALAIAEVALGKDHPETGICISNLGLFYYTQGRHHEAEPLLTRALNIAEAALGNDHPHTSSALCILAGFYSSQHRHDESDALLCRAFAALGKEEAELFHRAELCHSACRYTDTKQLLTGAFAILDERLGLDHPLTHMMKDYWREKVADL